MSAFNNVHQTAGISIDIRGDALNFFPDTVVDVDRLFHLPNLRITKLCLYQDKCAARLQFFRNASEFARIDYLSVFAESCVMRKEKIGLSPAGKRNHANSSLSWWMQTLDGGHCVPHRLALIDSLGTIVAVNDEWMALAEKTGTALSRVGPGVNYLDVCRQASGSSTDSCRALAGIKTVLKGKTSSFSMDYTCHAPLGLAHFRMNVTPIAHRDARVAIAHTDITDLQRAKEKQHKRLQDLARRLIGAQEEERLRIGREIHDEIGNRIALVSLSLRQFMKERAENLGAGMGELDKVLGGLIELSRALRNVSHWLHPPALRYLGLGAALKSLQETFENTHGIRIQVVVPPVVPRLPDELELCIFRISQGCLQNIAKHSRADKVRIVLELTINEIRLRVSDTGRGFDPSKAMQEGGLGLLSMKERALSLGGRFSVKSSPGSGTEIRVTLPIQDDRAVKV